MKLAPEHLCTGCGACIHSCPNNCLQMTTDQEGFRKPYVAKGKCVGCGLCTRACPVLSPPHLSSSQPLAAYAAYTQNDSIRQSSSSGGIFSELAMQVLSNGGAVFGAAYDEQFRVVHQCVESMEALAPLRGAKYAQSELGDIFPNIKSRLEQGQQVLFSGTPCQVAGLKGFLQKEYPNLLCVDFVCHGVPSPQAWNAYVSYRARQDNGGELPQAINLRSKDTGWSRYHYSNLFTYQTRQTALLSTESIYMRLFTGDCINRRSCESCRFKGDSRCSDLTLGDFWGIWDIAPEMDDDRGTSLLLIHSQAGAALFRQLEAGLVARPVCLEEAARYNPSLRISSKGSDDRALFLRLSCAGAYDICAERLHRPPKKKLRSLKRIAHRFLGLK